MLSSFVPSPILETSPTNKRSQSTRPRSCLFDQPCTMALITQIPAHQLIILPIPLLHNPRLVEHNAPPRLRTRTDPLTQHDRIEPARRVRHRRRTHPIRPYRHLYAVRLAEARLPRHPPLLELDDLRVRRPHR